jgi:hypothetical protein
MKNRLPVQRERKFYKHRDFKPTQWYQDVSGRVFMRTHLPTMHAGYSCWPAVIIREDNFIVTVFLDDEGTYDAWEIDPPLSVNWR